MDRSAGKEEEEETESRFTSRRSLKPWSWLFVFSIPTILALMCVWFWQLALVSVALMAPSARLFWWWRENREYAGPLDHVISSYAQGFYVIFVVANVSALVAYQVANAVLSWAVALIVPHNSRLSLLVEGLSFAAWVLAEEAWKLTFAYWAKQRRAHVIGDRNRETKAWVSAAIATAFGYATSQSILFVVVFTAIVIASDGITLAELGYLFLWGFLFGAVSQPLSILTSHLIGLELTRDASPLRAIKWPAAIRCAYVFQFFLWLALFYNVSSLAQLLFVALSVSALYYLVSKRILHVERDLPFEYMSEASRLRRRLGFALLNTDDPPSAADDARGGLPPGEHELVHRRPADSHPAAAAAAVSNPLPVLADDHAAAKDIVEL